MIPKIKSLIIDGQKIELEVSPQGKKDNSHCFGMCWASKGYIWVDSDLFDGLQKQTLLHETIHMIENLYELPNLSEQTVSTLANTLLQFMQDNPKIVDWLKGGA